jgi:hypothetical protein
VLRSLSHGPGTAVAGIIAAVVVMVGWMAPPVGAAGLPDGRAYELVSPAQKNGGDVIPDTQRTRAAVDGSAIGFTSLAGFAGNLGTGISSDYVSVRSDDPNPGTNGWTTRGTMPLMRPLSGGAVFAQMAPLYEGEFTPDLNKGLLFAWGALDGNANVDGVSNIYRNNALRAPGGGAYDLVSTCPLCDSTATPLPEYPHTPNAIVLRPTLAATSPDLEHVAFESEERLTADTPPQPGSCDMTSPTTFCRAHVYEWDSGTLRLAGRVPTLPATECDDANGPACVPADVSLAGQGTGVSRLASNNRTPHAISDGTDGHVRVFFTQPTDASGQTSDDLGNSTDVNSAFTGRIFMRLDGTSTVQLNASERTTPDTAAPAELLDASSDGTRVFFMTTEALTNDAPADGQRKLYMYDATKPASAPDNLTFLSPDGAMNDGDVVSGTIGASTDGHYVYFVAAGQLVSGQPDLNGNLGIYLWHDGVLAYVGRSPRGTALNEVRSVEANWGLTPTQSRVTPDGRHLLFSTNRGAGLTGYNHGSCVSALGLGCRELYVYSADSGQLACASCNPSGAPATVMATDAVWEHAGAATTSFHLNHALSDDGSRVFFTTAEALVPEDVNGRLDAYEYDVASRTVHLISTGTSPSDSYFLDASANGNDVFFITRERLVGWDRDGAYDLYDARVGGGFPEPVAPPACTGDPCQGDQSGPPAQGGLATTLFQGAGNVLAQLRPHAKQCRRGFVRKRVRGKVRCVKKRHHKSHRAAVRSKRAQHTQRRGS